MNRSQHYRRAEELAEEAVQVIARAERIGQRREARDDAQLLLRRAMVHATLASAPADVEPERAMAEPARAVCGHGYNQGDCPASACPFGPGPAGVRPKPAPPGVRS